MLDLQLLMGSWRQLQAVSRDPDAGEHREGGNQWVSTKEFGEEFHGSAVIETAPAEAGAVRSFLSREFRCECRNRVHHVFILVFGRGDLN